MQGAADLQIRRAAGVYAHDLAKLPADSIRKTADGDSVVCIPQFHFPHSSCPKRSVLT